MTDTHNCAICGEPMPAGEQMFKFHGYSGPCPKPPLPQPQTEAERMREAIAVAYGYLWHVNNEPGTPSQYPPERAAYEARKALRDLMTNEQRGEAINRVRELMGHNKPS